MLRKMGEMLLLHKHVEIDFVHLVDLKMLLCQDLVQIKMRSFAC